MSFFKWSISLIGSAQALLAAGVLFDAFEQRMPVLPSLHPYAIADNGGISPLIIEGLPEFKNLRLFTMIPDKRLFVGWFHNDDPTAKTGNVVLINFSGEPACKVIPIPERPTFGGYYIDDKGGQIATLTEDGKCLLYSMSDDSLTQRPMESVDWNKLRWEGDWPGRLHQNGIQVRYDGHSFQWEKWLKRVFSFDITPDARLKEALSKDMAASGTLWMNLQVNNARVMVLGWGSADKKYRTSVFDKERAQWSLFEFDCNYVPARYVGGKVIFTPAEFLPWENLAAGKAGRSPGFRYLEPLESKVRVASGKVGVFTPGENTLQWIDLGEPDTEIAAEISPDVFLVNNGVCLSTLHLKDLKKIPLERTSFNCENLKWGLPLSEAHKE